MGLGPFERQDSSCPPGSSWYVCGTGFIGCCSVEPCDQQNPGCLDPLSSSSSSSSLSLAITSTVTVTPLPSPVLSSISSTATPPEPPPEAAAPTMHNAESASSITSSSTPIATQSATSNLPSQGSNVRIVAGAVGTFVGLSIASLLIWLYLRRRRQQTQARKSVARYNLQGKDYVLERPLDPDDQPTRGGEVFAEFGGSYKPLRQASPLPAALPRPAAADDSIQTDSPIEAPLSDIEKTSLTPPPAHEHPAYRAPRESTLIYQPGKPMHTPQMTQHPTYHISQLSQHPAFLSGPSSPPRQTRIPRRTPEVKRQKPSPRAGRRSGPIDITPIISQLPSGLSELEAEVPDSYISLVDSFNAVPEMRISTQCYPQHYLQYQNNSSTRSSTEASRYSMPVGLGINSPHSDAQYQHQIQDHKHPIPPSASLPNRPVLSPTTSVISPQSPFHFDTQYYHHLSYVQPLSINKLTDLREGKEKEVVSPMSPGSWSQATCVETLQMTGAKAALGEPLSAAESSGGDNSGTWESWTRR